MKPKLLMFVLGLIVGLLIALLVPPLLNTVLPEGFSPGKRETAGRVVAKRLQEDRLLLTIESEGGAVLATFTQRVEEIDLLVETGDRVTLGITSYEPFVEDPRILGVKKGAADEPDAGEPASEPDPTPAPVTEPEPAPADVERTDEAEPTGPADRAEPTEGEGQPEEGEEEGEPEAMEPPDEGAEEEPPAE